MSFGPSQKMQAVNDCCYTETIAEGGVIVNMSLGASARHLYDVCVRGKKQLFNELHGTSESKIHGTVKIY